MEIASDFAFSLPPDAAFDVLMDLERVTPCLPGAELGERQPDGSRAVTVRVKLGPMRFTYAGTVEIVESDSAARTAVLLGSAKEARGQGDAQARIRMEVEEDGAGSQVTARAEVDLTGRAGQMGHGPVQAVSKQLIRQMTQCLETRFGAAASPDGQQDPLAVDISPGAVDSSPSEVDSPRPPHAVAPQPEPLRGGRLLLAVIRERLRTLFRRRGSDR